jgi:hypothetical protein
VAVRPRRTNFDRRSGSTSSAGLCGPPHLVLVHRYLPCARSQGPPCRTVYVPAHRTGAARAAKAVASTLLLPRELTMFHGGWSIGIWPMDQGGRQRSHHGKAMWTAPPPGSSSAGRIVTAPGLPQIWPFHLTMVHRKRVLAKHRSRRRSAVGSSRESCSKSGSRHRP